MTIPRRTRTSTTRCRRADRGSPIAPPPGVLRFGDVRVGVPEWLPREQAIQLNDGAAVTEAQLATFLDSIGMERTRSDRVAGQTLGPAPAEQAVLAS